MYAGQTIRLNALDEGLVELVLDNQDQSVNTLNDQTLAELAEAVELLQNQDQLRGLLISSAKPAFVVGADITEFQRNFSLSDSELKAWVMRTHQLFCALEELPCPTVAAINGMALGGGFELALAADFRLAATDSKVGLPEVNLGICPGWGGTVRLSRLIGAEAALEWMLSGKPQKALKAQQLGAVDRVVGSAELRSEALQLLQDAVSGEASYTDNGARKQQPLADSFSARNERTELLNRLSTKLDPNYPAAGAILELVMSHATLPFQQALELEADCIVTLAKSAVAASLIGLFMNDQLLKKTSKRWSQQAAPVKQAAVLGAGIMGGGVAFQSASTGTPILMKDIRDEALALGGKTAAKLLDRQIEKGRLSEQGKAQVMDAIKPTLDYSGFGEVDLVVEAVVENEAIKASVLAEVERELSADAVLASNTSTISIDSLAESVQRPEQFCGMHFFNPVHLMPLVEVIRGRQSSDATIARTVAYASAMGKMPIVVNDCPGFLVNRILFPYFNGFNRLLMDGVDFQRIDRVMEQFGWPMGPAYLADVIGLDTMVHADNVMQVGFPQRMGHDAEPIIEALLANERLGQKNGRGFYDYGVDDHGRRFKEPSGQVRELIAERAGEVVELTDQQIIDRMMIPMCLEAVRCLEDGIVETAAEVDMGLILGLGFPRFRGGALRYIDTLGLDEFAARVEANAAQGELYRLTEGFKVRQAEQRPFYG
ncbi:fatty acid oxidation complex subunit alpha FadB [Marinobacterium arenosum]|uniref:fatty acid oxidation complex subunit alpha FadB n=1 Tax=Marinobacterium arenosum TaxID=2862496 RepID=UPI001C94FD1D|nr:fatty acid oxidation complex subunit alpha FadB [Marinobacterium arenosum]MBY4675123.1 fatty acid oxidation complex subunit alpha FadB [Marinobacterium arenosum]